MQMHALTEMVLQLVFHLFACDGPVAHCAGVSRAVPAPHANGMHAGQAALIDSLPCPQSQVALEMLIWHRSRPRVTEPSSRQATSVPGATGPCRRGATTRAHSGGILRMKRSYAGTSPRLALQETDVVCRVCNEARVNSPPRVSLQRAPAAGIASIPAAFLQRWRQRILNAR
jgi:hypothetical protein